MTKALKDYSNVAVCRAIEISHYMVLKCIIGVAGNAQLKPPCSVVIRYDDKRRDDLRPSYEDVILVGLRTHIYARRPVMAAERLLRQMAQTPLLRFTLWTCRAACCTVCCITNPQQIEASGVWALVSS